MRNLTVFIIILYLCSCGCCFLANKRSSDIKVKPRGLFVSVDSTGEFKDLAPFLFFSKDGEVCYYWSKRLNEKVILHEIERYCKFTTPTYKNDSLFFSFNSMFIGFNTTVIQKGPETVRDSVPAYSSRFQFSFECSYRSNEIEAVIHQYNTETRDTVSRRERFIVYNEESE
jgi:hypothetical protein